MKGVVTLGEAMMVLSAPEVGPLRHARSLGVGVAGAEANVAIGVSRLGVPSRWIGRVGDDEPGRLVASALRGEAVETHAIVDVSAPTGLMLKERRTSSTTNVSYHRAGSAGSRLASTDLRGAWIADADVLHISGITPALSPSAATAIDMAVGVAEDNGITVSLDLNFRSRLWDRAEASTVLAPLARRADVLLAGDDEVSLVTDVDADEDGLLGALAELGPREVIIKRGARGARALIDGDFIEAPIFRVEVIDPVGAGDAFAAGYLAARCRGLEPRKRIEVAAAAGAFAVTVRGDWEGAPSWQELEMLRDGGTDVRR